MNKYKYLLKNASLLTISNFGTKILSFILIPIYTSYLSTTEYGTFDIYTTTISLLIPILSLNIIEAVMRFTLDKDSDKTMIFTRGIKYVIYAILIFSLVFILNKIFNLISIFNDYYILFILLFISEIIYNLFTQFSRGLEKIKEIVIAGVMNSAIMLLLNVLLLVKFNMGLEGYFIAYIASYIIPAIFLLIILKLWKYVKITRGTAKKIEKEMIKYSRPLIFNNIGWWINNVSDRYIVTLICGVDQNGVYSIAYKIPSILNSLQSIFSQAWTLSAVKEIDKGEDDFYSKIYKVYNVTLVITCSILIIFDQLIAKILFARDFYEAWKYAPFLMISVLFGSLSGMLGGIFSAVKRSKSFASTTMIGAIVNTILNIILVFMFGPIGAAIATLVAYVIVWALRYKEANKIVKLNISLKRDILVYALLVVQSIILLININTILIYIIEFIIFDLIIFIKRKDIAKCILKISERIKKCKN